MIWRWKMLCCVIEKKILSKDDLATTLRAHKTINDAGKSEPREYAIRHKAFEKKKSQQEHGHVVL